MTQFYTGEEPVSQDNDHGDYPYEALIAGVGALAIILGIAYVSLIFTNPVYHILVLRWPEVNY